ncbi:MAG: acyl-CoA thioesterase [Beijerinckiaceae bacterium]
MLSNTYKVFIEFGDCDPTGIVFNPRYFAWFDASVHALWRSVDLSLARLIEEYGIDGIPLVETRAKFHAISRSGEEVVVKTTVTAVHRCAFDLQHLLLKGEIVAVEASETRLWTAFDPEQVRTRARPIPQDIVDLLSRQ